MNNTKKKTSVSLIDKYKFSNRYFASPEKLKEAMLSILNGQDINTPKFKDLLVLKMEVIPDKYAGTADPHQAYALAHQAIH
jgi:hypothetical protein